MLLTLSTRSLASLIEPPPNGDGSLAMLRVPEFTRRQLNLRGLNVYSSMLAGWSLEDLDRLRDQADKAGCPCLVLIEDRPCLLADEESSQRQGAVDRIRALAAAANRLACNSLALRFAAPDTEETFERLSHELRALMPHIERYELNILLTPHEGLCTQPERLIELLKRVTGFRIGLMPSFAHAAQSGDPNKTLRQLAPYAGAIQATVDGFAKSGKHNGYDLAECVCTLRNVGFLNTLAIDYIGGKDAVKQIDRARAILEEAIKPQAAAVAEPDSEDG